MIVTVFFVLLDILCFLIISETKAMAYLDPGTGNALIAILVSVIGALFFALQSLYYKLTGNKEIKSNSAKSKGIVIFSEGKNYWGTWKGIVEKLIEKKQPFTYYTMDLHDPCLCVVSPFMDNRYIGSGSFAYAKLNKLDAKIFLSTTPNIGTEGYPVKRSRSVKNMVHIYHGLDDDGTYHRHALDSYDTVLLSGEFQVSAIRKLETLRGLKEKNLVPAGLPYIDELAKKVGSCTVQDKNMGKKTILIAPSWGTKNCLAFYGVDFVKKLKEANFNIIIRPHPQTLKVEQDLLQGWQAALYDEPNIVWDFEVDGSVSFAKADLMISDMSAVRLDFAVLYQKPVVTLETPIGEKDEYEVADLGQAWSETIADKIGVYVPKEEIEDIVNFVQQTLTRGAREDLRSFREENLYNFGNSAEIVANYLIEQLNEKER